VFFRLLLNLTSADTCESLSAKDIFAAFKSFKPNSQMTYYKLNILIQNVFPSCHKSTVRVNSALQTVFSNIMFDKENVTPLADNIMDQCQTMATKCGVFLDKASSGKLKFVHISAHKINGQHALKELVIHSDMSGVVTMCVGGQTISNCLDMLPSCTNLAEIQYNVQILSHMNICTGFGVTNSLESFVTDLRQEKWDGDNCTSVRSKQCHGLTENKMCCKCSVKLRRLNEKNSSDRSASLHEDHSYSIFTPSVKKMKPSLPDEQPTTVTVESDSDTDYVDYSYDDDCDSDPDYEPHVPDDVKRKIKAEINASEINSTLENIKGVIKDFAPAVAEPFLDLVECQLRNAKAPDKHLHKWDSRFEANDYTYAFIFISIRGVLYTLQYYILRTPMLFSK
jgi:hypothetical protein